MKRGGGTTSKGAAQIVCGPTAPPRLDRGYAVANGVHAVFCPADHDFPVMVIRYSQRRGAGRGTVYLVDKAGNSPPIFEVRRRGRSWIGFPRHGRRHS
ncbi:MAG: hypothetical protein KatS3mg038_0822 [Candidatus Kapaibacterium sp.]|nr:MAG: hypothetical protein KatS3mg038_0822 [Candidatus Kapabacteria bacterium]